MSNLQIRAALTVDRLPIYRMLELYRHDLSDIWDQELDRHEHEVLAGPWQSVVQVLESVPS